MPSAEELLSRQAPYSIEAEQAVLGSVLIDPKCIPEVIEILRPDDFYIETNRLVYDTIHRMFLGGRPIDGLCAALRRWGFASVRLRWAGDNPQARGFWQTALSGPG